MGIKLDGYAPDYFGLVFLKDHYHPLTPEMRNKTMVIPGMSGEWDFGSERGPKPFNLPFEMIEYDLYERQRKLNTLVAFLFDDYGKPREIKLTFDYEPDKFYFVKLAAKVDLERMLSTARFIIPFIAHKPEKKFMVTTDEIDWDSDIPFTADISLDAQYEYSITSAQTLNIINDGHLAVRPTILINGTADSLSLSMNGQTFSFGAISTPIEIIAEKYIVKVNGVSSLSAMTGKIEEMILLPGDNSVSVSGTNLNLSLAFRFNHQYI